MKKIRATKAEMRENYRIISIGYCNAHYLLKYENPIAYSAGVYGWACDYYCIKDSDGDEVIISTGYAPIASRNTKTSYEMIDNYNSQAREIINGRGDYEQKKAAVNELLKQFVTAAKIR